MMRNNVFSGEFSDEGQLVSLRLVSDPQSMNWVIDPEYLEETGYHEDDKLFGEFDITFDGKRRTSRELTRHVDTGNPDVEQVTYDAGQVRVEFDYDFQVEGGLDFEIRLSNESARPIVIEDFEVWIPFAYVMFRDPNVLRNIHQSAVAFPSISPSFTKLAMHRRSNIAPHVGLFQTYGETKSIGTFCAYTNLFFENVSPSLDGMLFHKLILAGGYASGQEPESDWIYRHDSVTVGAGERRSWT